MKPPEAAASYCLIAQLVLFRVRHSETRPGHSLPAERDPIYRRHRLRRLADRHPDCPARVPQVQNRRRSGVEHPRHVRSRGRAWNTDQARRPGVKILLDQVFKV